MEFFSAFVWYSLCIPFLQGFLLVINEYFTVSDDFCEFFCSCGFCGVYLFPHQTVVLHLACWTVQSFLCHLDVLMLFVKCVINHSNGFLLVFLRQLLVFSSIFSAVSLNSFCAAHYGLGGSAASLNSFFRIQGTLFLPFLQFLLLKLTNKTH